MRILLAIPSLGCGGSERVMSTLAAHWTAGGHEVSLATFEPPETDFFPLDPRLRRFVIGGTGAPGTSWLRANHARHGKLRRAVLEVRPDVVLSFLYTMNLLAIPAARGLAPVVVAERTDPRYFPVERWQAGLRRVLYPMASAVVVQTQAVLDGWGRSVARSAPVFAVPNPVLAPVATARGGTKPTGRVVASVGRLEPGKGFDALIAAFSRVAPSYPEWSLVVLGEGEEREGLTAQAAAMGLQERVLLAGTGNSADLFANADVYATATRVEGFPNALLEAMANGLPVVATDCHSGPREILRDGVDGYLVPVDDRDRLAHALDRLFAEDELRQRFGDNAREVLDRFSIESVASQWEEIFALVSSPPATRLPPSIGNGAALSVPNASDDVPQMSPLRVIVLTNQWPRPSLPYCGVMVVRQVDSLRRRGVEVEVISIAGGIRSYVQAARAVLSLNREPKRADVLHAHTGHSGLLACLQLRYPVVLTYVGYDLDTPAEDKEGPRSQLERVVFRSLSLVFAATIAKSARGARRLPRLGRGRTRVIPNGVDQVLFAPVPRDQARRQLGWGPEPTVLFAADPARYTKRYELAEAAVRLGRLRAPDLRLVVADSVDPTEMPLWMSGADVLILTSRAEGSPNVIKEAMACNLPIVTVDVGDVREIIGGTRNCYICSVDPDELARALVAVIEGSPERSDGRQRSVQVDDRVIADRIVALYNGARHRAPGVFGFIGRRGFS